MSRVRILYAAPGFDLAPATGPSRKVLGLGDALSRKARVHLAFRRVGAPAPAVAGSPVLAIEPDRRPAPHGHVVRADEPLALLETLTRIRRFAARARRRFDVVLEEGSRLSGSLAAALWRPADPPVLVYEAFRPAPPSDGDIRGAMRRAGHAALEGLVRRGLGRAALVLAESAEVHAQLTSEWGVAATRLRLAPVGVEVLRFARSASDEGAGLRARLGAPESAVLLGYVGSLDEYHDLAPLVRALGSAGSAPTTAGSPPPRLIVIGDGPARASVEALSRAVRAPVAFAGRVPPDLVPAWYAACDLAVAPYRAAAFAGGAVTFGSLKVPEALAAGRAVAVAGHGSPSRWIVPGETGFALANDEGAWRAMLDALPSRDQVLAMGSRARERGVPSWDATADAVMAACDEALSARGRRA